MTNLARPGDLLDHYCLEQLVSTSAMASVFRATDTRTGVPVAVKIPRKKSSGFRFFSDGFDREVEIGSKLDHPGIVKMLPIECAGRSYAVMEWAEGRRLRHLIDERGELTIDRAIGLALRISDVLDYIHSRGFIHLDLKPDNVIVGSEDAIKLFDFGLARETRGSMSLLPRAKRTGTPDYASPEQIAGKSVDARCDIYSLGVILYEMLAGEVPFSGVAPQIALNLKLISDPPLPSEANPNVTPEVDEVVYRATARNSSDRYPTAREFSSELQRACEFMQEFAGLA